MMTGWLSEQGRLSPRTLSGHALGALVAFVGCRDLRTRNSEGGGRRRRPEGARALWRSRSGRRASPTASSARARRLRGALGEAEGFAFALWVRLRGDAMRGEPGTAAGERAGRGRPICEIDPRSTPEDALICTLVLCRDLYRTHTVTEYFTLVFTVRLRGSRSGPRSAKSKTRISPG